MNSAPGRKRSDTLVGTNVGLAEAVTALTATVLQRHGRVDHLVHCAGIGANHPFLETPIDLLDCILYVNLRGTFLVGQAFAAAMLASAGGYIVNLANVSRVRGNIGLAAYASQMGGVIVLSQVMGDLARRIRHQGQRDRARFHRKPIGGADARRRDWSRMIPMDCYGRAEEIAAAAALPYTAEASYIAGLCWPLKRLSRHRFVRHCPFERDARAGWRICCALFWTRMRRGSR